MEAYNICVVLGDWLLSPSRMFSRFIRYVQYTLTKHWASPPAWGALSQDRPEPPLHPWPPGGPFERTRTTLVRALSNSLGRIPWNPSGFLEQFWAGPRLWDWWEESFGIFPAANGPAVDFRECWAFRENLGFWNQPGQALKKGPSKFVWFEGHRNKPQPSKKGLIGVLSLWRLNTS